MSLMVLVWLSLMVNTAFASVSVLTYHYNNSRTGADTVETILTPTNVNQTQFGKLFTIPVNGPIYAQPLFVPNLLIPGLGSHNVVYVATAHNTIYAFDADNGATLWSTMVGPYQPQNGCAPQMDMGIMGTPVISSHTIYAAAGSRRNGNSRYELHALDITTGAERSFSPTVITASVPGTGLGSVGGTLTFSPPNDRQRPALLLDNGTVYVGFASYCDPTPPIRGHGWLFAYNALNLARRGVWVSSPNGMAAGIWAAGGGPAADANHNVYFSTGNGNFDINQGGTDYGDSVIKLSPSLSVLDYFTPFNEATLESNDLDLSSGGVTLLPDQPTAPTHLLVTAGKQGRIYLINRDNLGKFNSTFDNVVQFEIRIQELFSTPTLWHNTVYFVAVGDFPKAFSFSSGHISNNATSQASVSYPDPGAVTVVSANGLTNGILWALQQGGTASGNEVLHAYDATNLAKELYNSDQAGSRDLPGIVGKNFESIMVANGKVYVPTGQPALTVFGLLPIH